MARVTKKLDAGSFQLKDQVVSINRVTKVVFDRGGYIYHGRIKAVADAAREAGLQF